MKKCVLASIGFFLFVQLNAQHDSGTCVKQINEAVWKPFMKYLMNGNKKGFEALHSKRITRVLIDNNRLQDFNEYFPASKMNDTVTINTSISRLFELRFDKRICNGNKAWETGYYKGSAIEAGKEPRSYYGRFFVVLEKEEGVWKIIVDADSGAEATAEKFNMAAPLE